MNRLTRTAMFAALAAGAVAMRRVIRPTPAARSLREPESRWLVLTVNRPQEEIAPQQVWPEPLAELADTVDIELRRAPANTGTEIAVRLRNPESDPSGPVSRIAGTSHIQTIRSALRRTKQLLETGEVIKVEPLPHGQRKPTPGGTVIAIATRRAGREGVL